MNKSNKLLSDIVGFRTYAKYLPHLGRREMSEETINRNMQMHLDKFPKLSRDIIKAYKMVHDLKILPSMRAMQFSGEAVLKNNCRQYNCSFRQVNDVRAFGEILFLLLSGTGVGFSVQRRHINQLPKVTKPREAGLFCVHDSIQGWAQALDVLCEAYFFGRIKPQFDFFQIRPKGSYLVTTGAKAPGPEPLKKMLEEVEKRLEAAVGRRLTPLEVHDIVCLTADCVLAGGIRRAATISLFDRDDKEMLTCKHGQWWEKHPYRARANNSAVLPRNEVTYEEFREIYKATQNSGSGEPGFSWTNNPDWGFNPCFTGDTLVAVADGRNAVSIKQLAEEKYVGPVYSIYNGEVIVAHCSKAWKTQENASLIKVTLDDGSSLRCTSNHRFMLRNGNYIEAQDLIPGTSLMPFNSYKRADRLYRMISSNTGKDLAQYRHVSQYYDIAKDGYNDQHIHHKDGDGTNDLPTNLESIDGRYHNSIRMLGGNNPIHHFKDKPKYRRLRSKATSGYNNPNFSGKTDEMIWELVYEKTRATGKKLNSREVLEAIGLRSLSPGQLFSLGVNSVSELATLAYSRMNHKVVSVEYLVEKEDVYDLTVDVTHNFAVISSTQDDRAISSSGVFVHNCHEISLHNKQFCNLSTINQTTLTSEKDFYDRIYSATLIGTLQAAYTDFPYLTDEWRKTTEAEALLGVSFTGIADKNNFVTPEMLMKGGALAKDVNLKYALKIDSNPAARIGAIKPEGSSSAYVGSSSGIHEREDELYLRRVRMNKDDALAVYLASVVPELVEDEVGSSTGVVITIPQESPKGAILKPNSTALSLFDRAMMYNKYWIESSHRSGDNRNNVSCTISVRPEEWEPLMDAMWNNRELYSGISLLPFDGGSYQQMPFESCSREVFEKYEAMVKNIDLRNVKEIEDNTSRAEQIACGGGACEFV